MSIIKYNPHIDGLRAIAVLSVILFHINPQWLPGGFIGVDIFFVISGYLITTILNKQLTNKTFSLWEFYNRRAKRILPALYTMVVVTIAVAYFLFLPNHLASLAKSAGSTFFFLSNVFFANSADYFSPICELMPLLHTWSLSVEEQFYVVWPTLLSLLLIRVKLSNRLLALILLTICICILYSWHQITQNNYDIKAFYYLFPARFGEMLIGAFLALYVALHGDKIQKNTQLTRNVLATTGGLLIALSLFIIDEQSHFPGLIVLLPCIGTALLIYSGLQNAKPALVIRMLQLRPLVFVGLLSYSLYLWHWPILAFIRYVNLETHLDTTSLIFAVVTIISTSYLSWKYVETPLRKKDWTLKKSMLRLYAGPLVLIISTAFVIEIIDSGRTFQLRDKTLLSYKLPFDEKDKCQEVKKLTTCEFGNEENTIKALVLGDSHTAHLMHYFNDVSKNTKIHFKVLTSPECPAIKSYSTEGMFKYKEREEACAALMKVLDLEIAAADHVFIALRWNMYFDMTPKHSLSVINQGFEKQLFKTAEDLTQQGKQVYFVNKLPEYENNVLQNNASFLAITNPLHDNGDSSNVILEKIASQYPDVHIVDINSTAKKWVDGSFNDRPMYRDWNHINHYGASFLAQASLLKGDFDALISESKPIAISRSDKLH